MGLRQGLEIAFSLFESYKKSIILEPWPQCQLDEIGSKATSFRRRLEVVNTLMESK